MSICKEIFLLLCPYVQDFFVSTQSLRLLSRCPRPLRFNAISEASVPMSKTSSFQRNCKNYVFRHNTKSRPKLYLCTINFSALNYGNLCFGKIHICGATKFVGEINFDPPNGPLADHQIFK